MQSDPRMDLQGPAGSQMQKWDTHAVSTSSTVVSWHLHSTIRSPRWEIVQWTAEVRSLVSPQSWQCFLDSCPLGHWWGNSTKRAERANVNNEACYGPGFFRKRQPHWANTVTQENDSRECVCDTTKSAFNTTGIANRHLFSLQITDPLELTRTRAQLCLGGTYIGSFHRFLSLKIIGAFSNPDKNLQKEKETCQNQSTFSGRDLRCIG